MLVLPVKLTLRSMQRLGNVLQGITDGPDRSRGESSAFFTWF
jgi:hypothetical protein